MEGSELKCRFCEREFNMKPHLVRHIKTMHADQLKPGDPESGPSVYEKRKAATAAKASADGAETPKRRPGRPKGSKNKTTKARIKAPSFPVAPTNNGTVEAASAIKEMREELAALRAFKQAVEESLNG